MAAADSSSLIAYFAGETGADIDALRSALLASDLFVPPAALAEFLSDPELPDLHRSHVTALSMLEPMPGYWHRIGATRAVILKRGLKARLADAMIAQSCIDADMVLIQRDGDFRHFAKYCGLKLA